MLDDAKIKLFEYNKHIVVFNGSDLTLNILPWQLDHSIKTKDFLFSQFTEVESKRCNPLQYPFDSKLTGCAEEKIDEKVIQEKLPILNRLSINISNTCNMACEYCYANKGIYYTKGGLMSKSTALNAVNFIRRNFLTIKHVNFFGGEPTLNQNIIELICKYFIYLKTQGLVEKLPQFGLTTNGYVISGDLFQILRKYNFSVTISFDGPKMIHNKLRINKTGSGTYDAIFDNVMTLIDMGINPEFECTYTLEHYKNDIDLIQLIDFFYDNFNCSILHCPIVITKPDTRFYISLDKASELYADAIKYSIFNLLHDLPKSISLAKRLLNSMIAKTAIPHYCPAGQSSITINADGNIYACFLLMDGSGYSLGNVNGNQKKMNNPKLITDIMKDSNKWENSACANCWAQALCFGCLGEDIVRHGTRITRSAIQGQSALCDYKRIIIESFLRAIAEACFKDN